MRSAMLIGFLLLTVPVQAHELLVDPQAYGKYSTIQAAIDAVPADNHERYVILIRNGTYHEQLRINNSFITLHGEDREKTRIVAEVRTSECQVAPAESKEENCAVVIGNGTDLVFENLTIENSVRPDRGKGAALSLVKDSTRIILHNLNMVGYGGDTLVLSARRDRIGDGGEYYLNQVSVSGTYHIIVPRGATYAVNSSFWCRGDDHCLFAEGITRETDKFVIKNSVIDGPEPFGLGSYFRDAAWYFVDDTFSAKLKRDGYIRREAAKNYEMKWGEGRIYFTRSKGPNYAWLRDNLASSPAESASAVRAEWVFPEWDPERTDGPHIKRVQRVADGIEVVFNESVTVEGKPLLGSSARQPDRYLRGSGGSTLFFASIGGVMPTQIRLNGGAIFASGASLHRRDAELGLPNH